MDHSIDTPGTGVHPLRPLFDPKGVVIVGASPRSASVGGHLVRKLTAQFAGPVYLLNPKHRSIDGQSCFPDVASLPGPVDLAVIASPAATVPDILADCARAGICQAVVISAGFGEAGDAGRALEARVRDVARVHGIRFVGPNCVGLQRPSSGLDASFLRSMPPAGRLGLVSQSGAICSAIVDWAGPNDLGFSSIISLGNGADVGFGEAISFLAADPQTDAILLYVEGVRDARRFVSALRAATRVKPVVVLKSGRGTAAAVAATTHTGALLGSDAAFDAALERGGAVRVETFGQLFAAAEILGSGRRAQGNRLGIVTNGGGAGVLATDRAEDMGIDLPAPSADTLAALDAVLSPHWSRANPLDIIGDAMPEAFEAAIQAGLDDPAFDGLLIILIPQAITDATDVARRAVALAQARPDKPVLFCWMGQTSVTDARRVISAAGLPDFTTPERAAEAFAFLARHAHNRRLAQQTPSVRGRHDLDPDAAREIVDDALGAGRSMLSDGEAKAVLQAYGIPVGATRRAASPDAALAVATELGWPVAVKIDSPDISHKSDVGGVRLGVATPQDLHAAFAAVTDATRQARPEARIQGVTIEPMAKVRDGRELLIGVSRDPVFGPVIAFGAGGTLVEVMRDSAVALPPLNDLLAGRLIDGTRVATLLGQFRNLAPVDRAQIEDVLLRVSQMVEDLPEIVALDINPLLAGPDEVLALDARIEVARPPAGRTPGAHLAIAPSPRGTERRFRLEDGRAVTLRPLRPDDAQDNDVLLRQMLAREDRDRNLDARALTAITDLARLTQADHEADLALLARLVSRSGVRPIGLACSILDPDGQTADCAVVVDRALRGLGVGRSLLAGLIHAARRQGIVRLTSLLRSGNAPMAALLRGQGFALREAPGRQGVLLAERLV
ncbi:acetyltransferase [Jannaschia pagri]|uniref:Acetyltransferase n=1 Tax=Jannaschia pagri TaxID=2829797 RepID=A0ABQ4NMP3_9RHOB|nr:MULTISPECIES: bifunctional acetate--CoA ligase family protein/GNAT family N-acetyltransferase [unclassified Jannaschia]GIT91548.1 acetyltransferase [Jannaschia sp. AI_61]GIT95382.1 acetyltransferase [Jannaschia sp. AI_62]